MGESILGGLLAVAILVSGAIVTQWFARSMYNSCPQCRILNAKRRRNCRSCGHPLGPS